MPGVFWEGREWDIILKTQNQDSGKRVFDDKIKRLYQQIVRRKKV